MAKFSMQAPQINTEELNDKEAIRRVQSYLYQLNEQLRYMMMNLDGENIQEGSIGETQLSRAVKQNINNIEIKLGDQEQKSKTLADNFGNYYTKIETAAQITTMMDDALGNYYTKTETAAEINTLMGDALGNYYTKSETATEINTRMGNALGDYYTKTETASYVGTYVGNNAYGKVSGIGITANGVDITGSKYIHIDSGGELEIGNWHFDYDGMLSPGSRLAMTSAYDPYTDNYDVLFRIRDVNNSVVFQVDTAVGSVQTRKLYLYDGSSWKDVTSAILALL